MEVSIAKLAKTLGIDPTDFDAMDSLELLLDDSIQEVLDYTRRDELVEGMESLVRQVAVINYNRRGMEGEANRNEGGFHVSFIEIPKSIQKRLDRYRSGRLRML